MGDLSSHFDSSEFGGPVEAHLVEHLEKLRSICGDVPMVIVSGYRSPEHNAQVGGAPNSQHLYGRAADIQLGYSSVDQAIEAGFTGIGDLNGWAVHVDVRPVEPARWTY